MILPTVIPDAFEMPRQKSSVIAFPNSLSLRQMDILDSFRSSHPVEVGCQVVNAVRAVRQIFDSWMLAVIVDEDNPDSMPSRDGLSGSLVWL
jgi:hypothetical protein